MGDTWVLTLFFGFPYLLVLCSMDGSFLQAILEFTAIVYGTIFAFMYGTAILLNAISWIVGRDPDDKQLRKQGYDVYFDNLPTGFLGINKDSDSVRQTGHEPQPKTRVVWNCNACGAEVEGPHGDCWNCGNCLENET